MNKFLTITGLALIIYLMSSKANTVIAKVVTNQAPRKCDPSGCGHFGASRGSRTHNGVDIVTVPGEAVFSPISGRVNRYAIPYANDNRYSGIEITGANFRVKMFYLQPTVAVGTQVTAGQRIGTAQNIAAKFSNPMTNHVHVEFYTLDGKLVDPTKLMSL